MSSNPNTESFEDQLYARIADKCDLYIDADMGLCTRCQPIYDSILAAHQATTDQRVAEALDEAIRIVADAPTHTQAIVRLDRFASLTKKEDQA